MGHGLVYTALLNHGQNPNVVHSDIVKQCRNGFTGGVRVHTKNRHGDIFLKMGLKYLIRD